MPHLHSRVEGAVAAALALRHDLDHVRSVTPRKLGGLVLAAVDLAQEGALAVALLRGGAAWDRREAGQAAEARVVLLEHLGPPGVLVADAPIVLRVQHKKHRRRLQR